MLIQSIIHESIFILCDYILYIIHLINNDYLRNLYFSYIDYFQINYAQSFLVLYIEKSLYIIICLYISVKYIKYKLLYN